MNPKAILARAGLSALEPTPLGGGNLSRVYRAGRYVIKTRMPPVPGMFAAEAAGLEALRRHGVRVPRVIWAGEEGLVLEYLPPGPPDWTGLGEMVAGLHRQRGPAYGWDRPAFLGPFAFRAREDGDWKAHYRWRLEKLIAATPGLGNLGEKILKAVEQAPLPVEGPAPLHGDLWSGNVHMSQKGPALLDPAFLYGERGLDLAMMQLFGGFPEAFWQSYEARYPIPPELEAALPCYQLYYLLVHVHFFGAGYLRATENTLKRCPA